MTNQTFSSLIDSLRRWVSPVAAAVGRILLYYIGGLFRRINEYHILLLGGGLAFSVTLCVIPLALVMFAILGSMLQASSIEQPVTTFIDNLIPYPQYSTYVKEIVFSRIDEVITHKALAGYLGGIGLLIAASGLFSSMRTVLNTIFGGGTSKPMVIGKLRDLGMILLVLVFFLVSTTTLPLLEVVSSAADRLGLMQYVNLRILTSAPFSIVSFSVSFIIFFILYYLIPYESLGKKTAAVSAFWAVVLWEMAKQGFGYYTGQFAAAGQIFGAYVMLVMVVLWIYFSAIVFIVGAEIGQLYREKHGRVRSERPQ